MRGTRGNAKLAPKMLLAVTHPWEDRSTGHRESQKLWIPPESILSFGAGRRERERERERESAKLKINKKTLPTPLTGSG